LVAGGGLLLLLLSGKKKKPAAVPNETEAGPGSRPVWSIPIWDPNTPNGRITVSAQICRSALAMAGTTILAPVLERAVWDVLWQGVPWPVTEADHESMRSAFVVVRELVGSYLADPASFCAAFDDGDDGSDTPTPDQPVPIDIAALEDVYPNDGYMYQARGDDLLGGSLKDRSIAYRTLLSSAWKAAKAQGADDETAGVVARSIANSSEARAHYIDLMHCALFNDMYLSTYGYQESVTNGGPNGRGFRLLKIHADNRKRLSQGLSPIRTVQIGTPATRGTGTATGTGDHYEYFSLPLLDRVALLNTNLPWADRIVPGRYADGSSGLLPPPEIQRVMSTLTVPAGSYGCGDTTLKV
jgi:hypothetical protein